MIRNAAAQDIVAFLGILEPKNWPECLTLLVSQLDDQDPLHQEVCHHLLFYSVVPFGCGWSSVAVALPPRSCRLGISFPGYARTLSGKYLLSITSRHRKVHSVLGIRPLPKNCHYRSSGGWIFTIISCFRTGRQTVFGPRCFPVYSTA